MKRITFLVSFAILSLSLTAQTNYYVKATGGNDSNDGKNWSTAKLTLQGALDVSVSGDKIWVAKGTYIPSKISGDSPGSDNRDKAFVITNGVSVFGGFEGNEDPGYDLSLRDFAVNLTVLSGDLDLDGTFTNNSYHVAVVIGRIASVTLDGFSITGGNGSLNSNNLINGLSLNRRPGPGVFIASAGADAKLTNCVIHSNLTTNWGGGVYAWASSITGNVFVDKNIIRNNNCSSSNGAGIYAFADKSKMYVTSNLIYSNTTTGNAGGAYIQALGANVYFINNTVSKNTSATGTLYCYTPTGGTGTITVANSIISGNTPNTVSGNSANLRAIAVDRCLVAGGVINEKQITATNIITDDPLFVDATNFNFRLTSTSPARNAGANAYNDSGLYGSTDLIGNDRVFQTTIDMGAYEYTPIVNIATTNPTLASLGLTAASDVVVKSTGSLTIDANTTVNSVTVEAGGKLNLTNPLVVTDVVLKADESGSFSANIGAVSTVTGTVHYERTMLDTKWYFMSFPCNINVAEITGGGTIDVDWFIQEYNGAHRATAGLGGNWSHITSGILTAKKGYIFGLKTGVGTKTLSFLLDKALIQSEVVSTVPATAHTGSLGANHNGWNLVGQPYLSKFAGTNVGLNYLTTWTGTAYDGKANTAVASINPFEAFFVQVADNNPISFAIEGRQTVRSLVDADFSDRVELSFTSATGSDNTNLIIDNDQSTAYEINQDLEKWITTGTDKPQVYTQLYGINYAYNALPVNNVINLHIGFYTKTAGSTTISVNTLQSPSLSKLLLTDNSTSPAIVTDLLISDYTFDVAAGTDNARFVITAQRISTKTIQGNEAGVPEISLENGKLKITNITTNDKINVFNSVGQLLFNNIANKSTLEIPLPKVGMYIIQIESEIKSRTIKIVNPKQL